MSLQAMSLPTAQFEATAHSHRPPSWDPKRGIWKQRTLFK